MSKFAVVKEAPEQLEKGEYVINMPNFIEEIQASRGKQGTRKLTGLNHLRAIASAIGDKYDHSFNPYHNVLPGNYEGIPFENDEQLSDIVLRMFLATYPQILDSYIDTKLKQRPFGTKLIYFTGPFQYSGIFTKNGLDLIDEKDIDVHMGRKAKKTVGKPMPTDEEVQERKKQSNP